MTYTFPGAGMVDRWTRRPCVFPAGPDGEGAEMSLGAPSCGPGYTHADEVAWVAGWNESKGMLRQRTKAAGVWLVGEGDTVDAHSVPGYGNGCVRKASRADGSLIGQMRTAAAGQGILASYVPGSDAEAFESALAVRSQAIQKICDRISFLRLNDCDSRAS